MNPRRLCIFLWAVAWLGAIVGAIYVGEAAMGVGVESAPQQAVKAIVGIAFAVIPYCIARAAAEIAAAEERHTQTKLLASLANAASEQGGAG